MTTFLQLFYEFFITGLFTIGGGLASLPFLYKIAERHDWFTAEMLPNMVAISESTPGPIGINMATYAGFHTKGLAGGIIATIAIALPSFLIIILVSKPLHQIKDHHVTKSVLFTLRPAVTGLIAVACWQVMRIALLNLPFTGALNLFQWPCLVLFGITWYLYRKYKKHPIFYIVGCALIGMLLKL